MCYYSWAAAAVGLFFSLWLFFMQVRGTGCDAGHRRPDTAAAGHRFALKCGSTLGVTAPTPLHACVQMCSGRSRHIPVCEAIVCLLASAWWLGCAITGGWVGGKEGRAWAGVGAAGTRPHRLSVQPCCEQPCLPGHPTCTRTSFASLTALRSARSAYRLCDNRTQPPTSARYVQP